MNIYVGFNPFASVAQFPIPLYYPPFFFFFLIIPQEGAVRLWGEVVMLCRSGVEGVGIDTLAIFGEPCKIVRVILVSVFAK